MDPEQVAAELYRLTPGEFVDARNRNAAAARAAGDRELANQIKALRRPTVAAWLVNLLVHDNPDQVDDLLELGVAMREAQQQLSGPDLRRLSGQRNELVAALVNRAVQAAARFDQPVTEAVRNDATQTLQAALADPGVADEVRAGRLSAAVTYSGFGPDILVERPTRPQRAASDSSDSAAGAGAAPAKRERPARPERASSTTGPEKTTATTEPDQVRSTAKPVAKSAAEARAQRKREQALEAARAEVDRSTELLAEARTALDEAHAASEQAVALAAELTAKVEDLRAQLAQASKESTAADREVARRGRRAETAEADLRAAERRVKKAEADLRKLPA